MFTKYDRAFATMASDPVKRQSMIFSRRSAREVMFWCAIVITALGLLSGFMGTHLGVPLAVGIMIQWVVLLKFDADIRLLSIIDVIKDPSAKSLPA